VIGSIVLSSVNFCLEETGDLRRPGKRLVVFDVHASHQSLRVLLRLAENSFMEHPLPARTSNFTQRLDVDAVDPWLDVHARLLWRWDSLDNSVSVTKNGIVCTAVGAHVTSAAVLNVQRKREVKREKKAKLKCVAAAVAVQKRMERATAAKASAAFRAAAATLWTAAASAAEEASLRAVAGARAPILQKVRPIHERRAIAKQGAVYRHEQ